MIKNPLFGFLNPQNQNTAQEPLNPLQEYARSRQNVNRGSALGDALMSGGSAMVTPPSFVPQGFSAPLSRGLQAGYNSYNESLRRQALEPYEMAKLKDDQKRRGIELDLLQTQKDNYGQISPMDQARIANLQANTAKTLNNMQNPRTMTKQDEMDYKAKKDRENKRYDQDIKILEGYTEKSEQADEYLSKTDIFKKAQAKLIPRGMGKGVFSSPWAAYLPKGDTPADREAVRTAGINLQMDFVGMTKGAISDKEMGLFGDASPSLYNTPEGNLKIIAQGEARALRVKAKEQFARAWLDKYGSLNGHNKAWSEYIKKNPIIDSNMIINEANISNWQDYLEPNYSSFTKSNANIVGGNNQQQNTRVDQSNIFGLSNANAMGGNNLPIINGQLDPSQLVVGRVYTVNGEQVVWDGQGFK